ncbi:hypothetical protein Tco_1050216 [Tanacetum coccineum]
MTTIVFTATTPQNTPSAYRASTLANPNPMISPAFVVANYEDYDKERKMEPRPAPSWEDTLPLRLRSHVVHSIGFVTSFVRWIEDYPLLDGLKMPSHIGSYDGKGDPDNFLHLFEGAIRMQKWLILVACYMFTYTLKDSARIWWNSQKEGSILNNKDLKDKFRSLQSAKEVHKDTPSGPQY